MCFRGKKNHDTIEVHALHMTLPLICPAQQAEMLNVLYVCPCSCDIQTGDIYNWDSFRENFLCFITI